MEAEFVTMDEFEVYNMYTSIKTHFSSKSYDYFKYNKKMNLSKNSYKKRKDRWVFRMLSDKSKEYLQDFFVSNFIENKKFWVGDIELGEKNYLKFIARRDALTYNFTEDLKKLKKDLPKNIEVKEGKLPYIVELYVGSKISLESLIIMVDLLKIQDYFDEKLDNPVWNEISFLMKKYKRFFSYDIVKFKNIFVKFCKFCKASV